MVRALSAMPLVAVDAIVIDTETTGLDTRTARIVQVGGVRLDHGHLADEEFDTLVNPMVPIPPATTKVHGVGDADVQDAPKFPEIWPKLLDFQGGALIVGHSSQVIGASEHILGSTLHPDNRKAARSGKNGQGSVTTP